MTRRHAILLIVLFWLTVSSGDESFTLSVRNQTGTSVPEDVCSTGRKQSPINIVTVDAVSIKSTPLLINKSWREFPIHTDITNNGHTILVQIANRNKQIIGGRILDGRKYVFQQLHMHWGPNRSGSEHTINSKRYAMEGHLVFYNANSKEPLMDKNGILVIAQFYKESFEDNPLLEYFLGPVTSEDLQPGETIRKKGGFPLYYYLPDIGSLGKAWSYKGSLTTPPCSENVLWLVILRPRPVSSNQLSRFRKIKDIDGNRIQRNYRDTQPLNGRKVKLVKF